MSQLTEIEKYVIEAVKQRRTDGEMSQNRLSIALDMSESFVGHVENPNRRAKYNINHLNKLAIIFKCSPRDFLPPKPFKQPKG